MLVLMHTKPEIQVPWWLAGNCSDVGSKCHVYSSKHEYNHCGITVMALHSALYSGLHWKRETGMKAWIIMVNLKVLRINDRLDTIISNHELE